MDQIGITSCSHFVQCVDGLTAYLRILKQQCDRGCEMGVSDFSQQEHKTLPSSACLGIPADLKNRIHLSIVHRFTGFCQQLPQLFSDVPQDQFVMMPPGNTRKL